MDGRTVQPDGEAIRRLRQARFWSQERLAEAATLRKRTVERAEAGQRLHRSTLQALAQALNCAPDALLFTVGPVEPQHGHVPDLAREQGDPFSPLISLPGRTLEPRLRDHAERSKDEPPYPLLPPSPVGPLAQVADGQTHVARQSLSEAERRHLTVLFCDIVNSTALTVDLDPEVYREMICAYHAVCLKVIEHFDGYIAQYLGDGVLVYFGYPHAHEDDAQRAVRAGLGIVEALQPLQARLQQEQGRKLAVRVGIHSGLVVVGDVGGGARHEPLALGQAPNLAARLQARASPGTILISPATESLVHGWFVCESLGQQTLEGVPEPMMVYHVVGETGVQNRLDITSPTGLTPLVGREREVELLLSRWEHAKEGLGQVVIISGEPGIGKSRLVRGLQQRLVSESYARLECRCSPYTQHSALYPVIDLSRRVLQWQRGEPPDVTLGKLEAVLTSYDIPVTEGVPLLASLLSLPVSEHYPPLQLTPQRQKQKTLEIVLELLLAQAAQKPVLFIVEDVHWIDPSTLELLALIVDQGPTAQILTLFTCRPEFHPPWGSRAHVTTLTLGRLPPSQVRQMMDQITEGKTLPLEVRRQVVTKTDGVPLFVEELTKMVLESGLLRPENDRYELLGSLPPLAIPATLNDSLMARLDRLPDAKEVAQLGATLGRTFSYELLQAVSPWDEEYLRSALSQLVNAELLYQRGVLTQMTFQFKHALIQETAYQSLLRSTRQRYHQQTVHVLEQQFPEIAETRPEFLAYHYTEAGLPERAAPFWQRAGEHAAIRSANVEAISHFSKGLEVLKALPETPARRQQELELQLAIGTPLMMLKGHTAPEVEYVYAQAYELAQKLDETTQRFSVLVGRWRLYLSQARLRNAHELAAESFALAQRLRDPALLQEAHLMLGSTFFYLGEPVAALADLEQAVALYDPQQRRPLTYSAGTDPGVTCLCWTAWTLWKLGYVDRALTMSHQALSLSQELLHPYSLGFALFFSAVLHKRRRETQLARERADAAIELASGQGFLRWWAGAMIMRGWALAEQGSGEEGMAQIRQGLEMWRAMGGELGLPHLLAALAEVHAKEGQIEEGLRVLSEALVLTERNEEHRYESELYRLKGELLLRRRAGRDDKCAATLEAEACFLQALDISRHQQAKSLELRAVMSLSRLWQQQAKCQQARNKLAGIYNWFTEGLGTPDLREAKALLESLA